MIFPVDVTTSQPRRFQISPYRRRGRAFPYSNDEALYGSDQALSVLNAAEILGFVTAEKGEEAYKRGGRGAYHGSVKSSVDGSPCEKSVKMMSKRGSINS